MGDRTPKRTSITSEPKGFSPVILATSPATGLGQKNLTGPPRVARDITADLYNNIQRWNDLHIKGALIVKQIASLKADNPKNLSPELEKYTNSLFDVVQSLKFYSNVFENLQTQVKALGKLQKTKEPVFFSLSAVSIGEFIETVVKAYHEEIQMKQFVLENIAHSKNNHEAMFLAACWTHQLNITDEINLKLEGLLTEMGHRKIS